MRIPKEVVEKTLISGASGSGGAGLDLDKVDDLIGRVGGIVDNIRNIAQMVNAGKQQQITGVMTSMDSGGARPGNIDDMPPGRKLSGPSMGAGPGSQIVDLVIKFLESQESAGAGDTAIGKIISGLKPTVSQTKQFLKFARGQLK